MKTEGDFMKTYKQITEMAMNIGDSSFTPMDNESFRKREYDHNKDNKVHSKLGKDVSVHKHTIYNRTEIDPHRKKITYYHTLDHNKKECLHHSVIEHHMKSKSFPFNHEVQVTVGRHKDGNLPKGHATDVTYEHFHNSTLPLKSSDEQYRHGHNMWRRLAHKALKDGHRVYHWDGKSLHKTTSDNIEEHLDSSFGKDKKFKNRHMILSKDELHG